MATVGAAARRERARQEMRSAILESARRLVSEEGVEALSMRAIARDLGYSPAALYEYFPAKEDVSRALFFEGAEGLAGLMEQTLAELPAGASAVESMCALGRGYRAYARAHAELFRLAFASTVLTFTPEEVARGHAQGGFGLLVETARRGVETGEFVQLPAELVALHCWAGVHGFVMLELSGMLAVGQGDCLPEGIPADAFEKLFEQTLQLIGTGTLRR